MEVFTLAFFGHRCIDNPFEVEENLEKVICDLVAKKEYIEFLVGRNGEFDQCVTRTIRKIKREYRDDNSELILVLPYVTAEYSKNEDNFKEYYYNVEISLKASSAHPKSAIEIRNREMIDRRPCNLFCRGALWRSV